MRWEPDSYYEPMSRDQRIARFGTAKSPVSWFWRNPPQESYEDERDLDKVRASDAQRRTED